VTARPSSNRPRLLLADDHRLVLENLAAALRHHYDIAPTASNGAELLDILRHNVIDCVVTDIAMPGQNGLELIPAIRSLRPCVPIILLTMLQDRGLADLAFRFGANAYVPKTATTSELREALDDVLAGRRHLSRRIPARSERTGLSAKHEAWAVLTPRQQQILRLLGECKSCAQISRELNVGESTIAFHKQNILRKLGFREEAHLIQYAVLINDSPFCSS